jgi:predicted NUDIX family NTP pyrophosphohydrolase
MRRSAETHGSLICFRRRPDGIEVLLVHPGGPFWAKKDDGAWSIPKGEHGTGEDPLAAAIREFREETGFVPAGPFVELTPVRQAGGKVVRAWAFEGDVDATACRSTVFTMEWPPRSGRQQTFPEVDRAAWFALPEAARKILKGQAPLMDELARLVGT